MPLFVPAHREDADARNKKALLRSGPDPGQKGLNLFKPN